MTEWFLGIIAGLLCIWGALSLLIWVAITHRLLEISRAIYTMSVVLGGFKERKEE